MQQSLDAVVRALQSPNRGGLIGMRVVSGFTLNPDVLKDDEPSIEPAGSSCIHRERHRRFCNLPGLMLPVEPQWSCIVWLI